MSKTMSASGAQASEPRPGLSNQAAATSPLVGMFAKQPHGGLAWAAVRIWTDIEGELRLEASDLNGFPTFLGSSVMMNIDPLHPPAKFASNNNPESEFVYASLCDDVLTLTYIQYPANGSSDPVATGVWLGTSSGGQVYPPVKV